MRRRALARMQGKDFQRAKTRFEHRQHAGQRVGLVNHRRFAAGRRHARHEARPGFQLAVGHGVRAGLQRVGWQGAGVDVVKWRIGDNVTEAFLDDAQSTPIHRPAADSAGDDVHARRKVVACDVLGREFGQ